MNEGDTGQTVYFFLDEDAPLTEEELESIQALEGRPIDLSDAPEAAKDSVWETAGPETRLGKLLAANRQLASDMLAARRATDPLHMDATGFAA